MIAIVYYRRHYKAVGSTYFCGVGLPDGGVGFGAGIVGFGIDAVVYHHDQLLG